MTKEERKEYNRLYSLANKDKSAAYQKKRRANLTLPFYIVYCLPNENPPYCSKTNRPHSNIHRHEADGKDTSDWFILDVCNSSREALDKKKSYHNIGYGGAHTPWLGSERGVDQFEIDGQYIRSFDSLVQAAAFVDTTRTNLSHCLSGRQKTCKGFIFKHSSL